MNPSRGPPSGPSSRIGEENMSLYFDFGNNPAHQDRQRPFQSISSSTTTSTTTSQDSQDSAPRPGGIRVSLACIPCRSRHVKCGAEMPSCARCAQDDKLCFYAKSRRGMRDRNAPRKRASLRKPPGGTSPSPRPAHALWAPNPLAYPIGGAASESYAGPPEDTSATGSPGSVEEMMAGRLADPRRLGDLYYNFFHKAHPYVLPQYYFQARLDTDAESLKYLYSVMQYIGSLYASDISSSDLRELALSQLDDPNLPPNGFTVQALLLMAIAMFCDDAFDQGRAILDRAIYMALEMRMNSRTFANMERDPVLAESWRRTYWGLYLADSQLARFREASTFLLFSIEANVELPCEEYDYDGIIPRPRTLSDYEARDFEDEETVFSSFTYLIDLSKISGSLLGLRGLYGGGEKRMEAAVENADAMLVNWRLHLPREKQGVVDKNEEVDELLFQAHNLLQLLLVYIHRPFSRLYRSPTETVRNCVPPPTAHAISGNEDRSYWTHTKKTLEAAECAVNLYALPIPILQHSPMGICGLASSTLANLSACGYILHGAEWYRTRDRIRLGLGGMKKFGDVWKAARLAERETKKIARGVFALPRPGLDRAVTWDGASAPLQHHAPLVDGGQFGFPMLDQGLVGAQPGLTGFEDLNGMDYLSMLESAQAMSRVHS